MKLYNVAYVNFYQELLTFPATTNGFVIVGNSDSEGMIWSELIILGDCVSSVNSILYRKLFDERQFEDCTDYT